MKQGNQGTIKNCKLDESKGLSSLENHEEYSKKEGKSVPKVKKEKIMKKEGEMILKRLLKFQMKKERNETKKGGKNMLKRWTICPTKKRMN